VTHILCQRCSKWQGNVGPAGPIGWLELYDDTATMIAWFWDHDCGRIVIRPDELAGLPDGTRVRRYPTATG
jgi:hypothetical protein